MKVPASRRAALRTEAQLPLAKELASTAAARCKASARGKVAWELPGKLRGDVASGGHRNIECIDAANMLRALAMLPLSAVR